MCGVFYPTLRGGFTDQVSLFNCFVKCLLCCFKRSSEISVVGVGLLFWSKWTYLTCHSCVRARACCQSSETRHCRSVKSVHSNSKRKKVDFPYSVYSHFKALHSCEISEINFEQILWLSAMSVFYKVVRNLLILEPQIMVSAKKHREFQGRVLLPSVEILKVL